MSAPVDAVLIVSFGGPEGPDDVLPFLENVLRGRHVPRERMLEVAEHYRQFGGISPLNAQNRALIEALEAELAARGPRLPVYWGNRNWHPLLPDTLAKMAADGIRHALAFVTSANSSYSSCRQYRENIAAAREKVGPTAPTIEKLRPFFNHPGFLNAAADRLRQTLAQIPDPWREEVPVLFSAHSIPLSMAQGCDYQQQLKESARLVADMTGVKNWRLVYQSRSGPPQQPWLEPDVCDAIRQLAKDDLSHYVVIHPLGFVSDHMEVVYDLDTEARAVCDGLGLTLLRAGTVGTHPMFISMIRQLIVERIEPGAPRLALGRMPPRPDECPVDCCLLGAPARS